MLNSRLPVVEAAALEVAEHTGTALGALAVALLDGEEPFSPPPGRRSRSADTPRVPPEPHRDVDPVEEQIGAA